MNTDTDINHIVVDNKSQILFVICAIIIFSSALITFYKHIILRDFEVVDVPIVEIAEETETEV